MPQKYLGEKTIPTIYRASFGKDKGSLHKLGDLAAPWQLKTRSHPVKQLLDKTRKVPKLLTTVKLERAQPG